MDLDLGREHSQAHASQLHRLVLFLVFANDLGFSTIEMPKMLLGISSCLTITAWPPPVPHTMNPYAPSRCSLSF